MCFICVFCNTDATDTNITSTHACACVCTVCMCVFFRLRTPYWWIDEKDHADNCWPRDSSTTLNSRIWRNVEFVLCTNRINQTQCGRSAIRTDSIYCYRPRPMVWIDDDVAQMVASLAQRSERPACRQRHRTHFPHAHRWSGPVSFADAIAGIWID